MTAFREKDGSWSCSFHYKDWTGAPKRKHKRGFATKREAVEFESQFKLVSRADMSMKLKEFVKVYFKDKENELKERSKKNKKYMMDAYIVSFFGEQPMNEISAADVIAWQNEIQETNNFSESYLRMIQNQLTALFTHAERIYGLKNNPCKRVKKMGNSDSRSLTFWTLEEYEDFISTFKDGSQHRLMFEILFWTGIREGELLALTKSDIDTNQLLLSISKTYYRINGQDIITIPKTKNSIRTIDLPAFLVDEIKDYYKKLYCFPNDERLFPNTAKALQNLMERHIKKAGVKKIRVHDLRHSHCAYLINQGVQPLIIKERLGHKDIKVTLNTYGHLYPSEQKKVATMLDNLREKGNKKDDAPT